MADDKIPTHSVKLVRVRDSASTAAAPPRAPVVVKGNTWLTATEIKDRPQEIQALWRESTGERDSKLVWLSNSPPDTLTDHEVNLRDSDPSSIDMTAAGDLEWRGQIFICPVPKGTCTNLCRWVRGSLRMDANHLSISGEWHDKKHKSDCSGLEDEPDSGSFTMQRLVGVSFVPLAPGKYMNLVGVPPVGTQIAQFKAVVRIAARYDGVANANLRATADRGQVSLVDKTAGLYDFVADRSGVYELSFEMLGSDGMVFHTDRMRIEIPAIPGLGN
jgi:hypothetical protein